MTDQEINEAVARKLGWTITGECGGLKAYRNFREDKFSEQEYIPNYIGDITAAWEITERFNSFYLWWDDSSCNWWCHIDNQRRAMEDCRMEAQAETAPMAVCLAFLKLS